MNPKELKDIIRRRRSIYPNAYSDAKVDESIIEEMLENANWAPTHKLTEPWRFVVFSGDGLKKLADFQSELYKKTAEAKGNFNEKTYDMLKTKPLKSSHIIAIGMKRDEEEKLPEIEELSSVAMAVQNMYLTATAHGLGCYWGSGGITYNEEAKPFFGLGPKDKFLGFLFIGKPSTDEWPEGKRNPIMEKVIWVKQ